MDERETRNEETTGAERRDFLKKAGTVAVTAPAVALLLSANSKQASAGAIAVDPYKAPQQDD